MSEAPSIQGMIWPLRRGDTLASYDWHPFFHHRFLQSEFLAEIVLSGQRAEGFTAVLLWSVAINEDPAGTLPLSDRHLAVLARCGSLAEWQAQRDIALRGWVPVQVEDDRTGVTFERLGHPMTLSVVGQMMERKRADKARRSAGSDRQKAHRIKRKLQGMRLPPALVENPEVVNRLVRHFNLSGIHVTDENIRAVLVQEFGLSGDVVPLATGNSTTRSSR